ncbi:MAG: polysaccharide deacetylase family protein [Pseudomonadota bacterium]
MRPVTITVHHHIGDETDFEKGLSLSTRRECFEAHISWLAREYDVIDLSTLLSGNLPRRPLLLTFDDPYFSIKTAINDVLKPRGLPSVFFLNPALLDDADVSIDRLLAVYVHRHGLADVMAAADVGRSHADLGALIRLGISGLGAERRQRLKASLRQRFGAPPLSEASKALRREDLAEFEELKIEIGNHTATHVHGRALTRDEIQTEIVGAKHTLERLSGRPVRAFASPYGNEADLPPPVLRALRDSGHAAIFLVHARANLLRPHRDVWYRVSLKNEAVDDLPRALSRDPILRRAKAMMRL